MHETLCFPAVELDTSVLVSFIINAIHTLTYIECLLDYDSDLFPAKTLLQKRLAAAAVPENLSISLLFILFRYNIYRIK